MNIFSFSAYTSNDNIQFLRCSEKELRLKVLFWAEPANSFTLILSIALHCRKGLEDKN